VSAIFGNFLIVGVISELVLMQMRRWFGRFKISTRNSTTNAKQYAFRRGMIHVARVLGDATNLKSKLKQEMGVGRPGMRCRIVRMKLIPLSSG
jgi:hypothetical protein